jgi:hypothetical protein
MRASPSDPAANPDVVETVPAPAPVADPAATLSDVWDSEAPTAVHARRPLFARPPRLPQT